MLFWTKEKGSILKISDQKKKQLIATVITIIVLVVIFAGVIPKLGNYDVAIEEIKSMRWSSVALLVIFTIINILVYVFPYMASLPKLRYWPGFVLRQTAFVISNAIPGGGALGIGLQAAMLRDYGFKGGESSSAIVLTGASNILATITLPGVAALTLLVSGQIDQESALKAAISVVIAASAIGIFTVVIRSEKLARKLGSLSDKAIKWITKLLKIKKEVHISSLIMDFRKEAYEVTMKRWHLLAGSNLLQQLGQFSVLFVALSILDPGAATFATIFWAYALAKIGSFIPLTPGGIGTVDAILISLLISAGISSEAALASTLIWRFATFVPQMFLGIATFLYWRVSQSRGKYTP